jgi:putative transposase
MGVRQAYFYRFFAAYKLCPKTSTLLPRAGGRPSGLHLLSANTESLVHKCIEDFYMSDVRPSFAALTRRIAQECRRVEVQTPNYRTIRQRLAEYDPKGLTKARFGTKAAEEAFRPVHVNIQPTLPFQLLQIDHSPMDLIVLDERDRLPIGRPWISLAIDVATRVVARFYLSLESPRVVSVALVLTHACWGRIRGLPTAGSSPLTGRLWHPR